MRRSHIVLVSLCCLLLVPFVVSATADSYEMTITETTNTPPVELELEGATYDVSEVVTREPGESITVEVSVPDDEQFTLDLYNTDRQIEVSSDRLVGSETVTLDTTGVSHGTYLLGLYSYSEGDYVEVYPVVISGYTVTIDAPAKAATNDAVTIEIDVAARAASKQPARIEIGIWNNETVVDLAADHLSGSEYRATVSPGMLTEGEYHVYATTQTTEEINGYPVSHGLSDAGTLTITPPDDSDETDTGMGEGGENGENEDTEGDDKPERTDGEDTDGAADGAEDGQDGTGTNGSAAHDETGEPTASREPSDNDSQDHLIQLNDSAETDGDAAQTDTQLGVATTAILAPLLALLVTALVFAYRG